jgi:hypothetical protein
MSYPIGTGGMVIHNETCPCHNCARSIDDLKAKLSEAESERARLLAAIEAHRDYIWGDGPVAHIEDAVLYKALEGK